MIILKAINLKKILFAIYPFIYIISFFYIIIIFYYYIMKTLG